jgi:general secretion pathway protein K
MKCSRCCRQIPERALHDPARDCGQRGAVLIVVLWVLVALAMLALSFSAAVRTEVNATRNTVDQKQSYFIARAGFEYAIYKILESQSAFYRSQAQLQGELGRQIPEVLTGHLRLDVADGGADVEVIDETGKISLNLAPPHLIFNLLVMVGVNPDQADIITDSIEDWRDQDDLSRPNGAEADYYQNLDPPYFPKNGLFDVPEELLLVRGVTPEVYYGKKGLDSSGERVEYYGLQKYFTTFSNIGRINVNSAPIPVLAAIPGFDYEVANEIAAMRYQEPLMDISQIMERIPGLPMNAVNHLSTNRSQVYTIVSSGSRGGSEVISRIRAVVRIGQFGPKPYSIQYWNESNMEM